MNGDFFIVPGSWRPRVGVGRVLPSCAHGKNVRIRSIRKNPPAVKSTRQDSAQWLKIQGLGYWCPNCCKTRKSNRITSSVRSGARLLIGGGRGKGGLPWRRRRPSGGTISVTEFMFPFTFEFRKKGPHRVGGPGSPATSAPAVSVSGAASRRRWELTSS